MLRACGFLPLQLRAAAAVVAAARSDGLLTEDDIETRLFGKSREFARRRVPLVNNLAHPDYMDQYGRTYTHADPSDYEEEADPAAVPYVPATNCLFVAVPNALRHAANEDETSVSLDSQRLPEVDEVLQLTPTHGIDRIPMTASVLMVLEPKDDAPRISSGLIMLQGYVPIHNTRCKGRHPQAVLEALMYTQPD